MRDHLLDLVSHTFDLGSIEQVRVVGTDAETKIFGKAEDNWDLAAATNTENTFQSLFEF